MARQPSPEEVIAGYKSAVALVRSRVVSYAKTAWIAQGSYRDADIDRLVSLIVPRVQAGQIQTANLTSTYIASVASIRQETLIKPSLVKRFEIVNGRGVPADEVYRRPAIEMYSALSEGKPFTAAKEQGLNRLVSLVSTDMQMAKVRQSDSSYRSSGAKFYHRILGDGGKSGNCGLCIIASTQRYRVGDLLPIHPGCSCDSDELDAGTPVFEALDGSSRVLDPGLLEDTHARIEDFTGASDRGAREPDYRDILVRDHGEYGPTLSWRSDSFAGPADLK